MGGKFSREQVATGRGSSPVASTSRTSDTQTYNAGPGFTRDPKSELFLLAVSNFVGEDTFYEAAGDRDNRYAALVAQVTQTDPEWIAGFAPYLREKMRMRSASVVMAAEYVKAGGPNGRGVVDSVLKRADEPGEMLAYWTNRYGRPYPQAVKRGVADAVKRLYTERNHLKYDGSGNRWRFGHVIEMVHPDPRDDRQSALFRYAIERAHKRENIEVPETLAMVRRNRELWAMEVDSRRAVVSPSVLREGGMSWVDASGWINGPLDANFWQAIIPSMGVFALIRNLRNFDAAGISEEAVQTVTAKITSAEDVEASRALPLRFLTAWIETGSMRWGPALEEATELATRNVPSLAGNTLILIDVSGSMDAPMSARSHVQRWQSGGVFGYALANAAERANVVAYSTQSEDLSFRRGQSVLRAAEQLRRSPVYGGGTDTFGALQRHFSGHDRVVILTDEQADPGYLRAGLTSWGRNEPLRDPREYLANTPVYTFNLAGYRAGHAPSGTDGWHTFGGLSDSAFEMLPLLEAGRSADWPWLKS
jgi:hypothetical protein